MEPAWDCSFKNIKTNKVREFEAKLKLQKVKLSPLFDIM